MTKVLKAVKHLITTDKEDLKSPYGSKTDFKTHKGVGGGGLKRPTRVPYKNWKVTSILLASSAMSSHLDPLLVFF